MKKKLKRNGSIGGSSSSELEDSVGFLGKIKNGVGCADVSEDREGLGMVGNKDFYTFIMSTSTYILNTSIQNIKTKLFYISILGNSSNPRTYSAPKPVTYPL